MWDQSQALPGAAGRRGCFGRGRAGRRAGRWPVSKRRQSIAIPVITPAAGRQRPDPDHARWAACCARGAALLAPGIASAPAPIAQPADGLLPATGGSSRSGAASSAAAAAPSLPTAAPTRQPVVARSPSHTTAPAGGTLPPPPPRLVDSSGRLLLSPGGGPVLEGGNCTAPVDCQLRNSSCIFSWTNGTLDTTVGFCAVENLPDRATCTKNDDCQSNSCKEVQDDGSGDVCAPGTGAPCSRNEQCALFCSRPFCL